MEGLYDKPRQNGGIEVTQEQEPQSLPIPENLRECIIDELNEILAYGRDKKSARLTMHPKTLAILDNQLPASLIQYTVHLDSSLKVGSFRVT